MTGTTNEKQYTDSIFCGLSTDSAPIKDTFEKFFVAKNLKMPLKISKEQLKQACARLSCSEENFFMGAYGLLLARFAGADEVLFAATGTKKIPVALNFSPDQNISDLIKILRDQVNRSREIIQTPYEKISETYGFQNVPEFISTPQKTDED